MGARAAQLLQRRGASPRLPARKPAPFVHGWKRTTKQYCLARRRMPVLECLGQPLQGRTGRAEWSGPPASAASLSGCGLRL